MSPSQPYASEASLAYLNARRSEQVEVPFNNTTGCTVPTVIFSFFFKTLRFELNSLIHWPSIPPISYVRASPLPSLSVFPVDAAIPGMVHP